MTGGCGPVLRALPVRPRPGSCVRVGADGGTRYGKAPAHGPLLQLRRTSQHGQPAAVRHLSSPWAWITRHGYDLDGVKSYKEEVSLQT
jgi:hypothetical protein